MGVAAKAAELEAVAALQADASKAGVASTKEMLAQEAALRL
jgi:hypothetical protein